MLDSGIVPTFNVVLMRIPILLATLTMLIPCAALAQDHTHGVNARGAHVMGFDQDKTRHQFRLHSDGGAIDISVKDAADSANRDAIRSHLPHIAAMFGGGDFNAPMLIHATNVPGTDEMARLKNLIRFAYVETPRGGRLDIITTDPAAVQAVHEFMRFQISDHKTGDSTAVTRR
jgi:hypothetical protein